MSESNEKSYPKVSGKVLSIGEVWQNDAGTFWKREVVIETGYKYPNPIKVVFQKERTSHLEGVAVDDCIIVPYVLNGREYNDRYYVDIIGMGLEKIGGGAKAKPAAKPVVGCTAATAIETWAKYHGDDKAAFAEFCKSLKPGKSSKDYNIGDWADVVNAIEQAATADANVDDGTGDVEDLPF
jgi:hypothetical protein